MKTRIENHTRYDTRALAAVVHACEKHLNLRQSRRVIVRYSKKSMLWGHATYPHGPRRIGNEGTWCELFLPGDPAQFDFTHLALLVEHELLHNLGLKHRDYGNIPALYPRTHRGEPPPKWAAHLAARGVPFHAEPKKTETDRRSDAEHRMQVKADRARALLAAWERKAKLARTKVKKLTQRVAYYERQLSAEAVAARAARPVVPRKARKAKLKIEHGCLWTQPDGRTLVRLHVGRRAWDEIDCRIMDVDFDESMADVAAMKEEIAKHLVVKKSRAEFYIDVDRLPVLARELGDMQMFDDTPVRALARVEQEVREFIAQIRASRPPAVAACPASPPTSGGQP